MKSTKHTAFIIHLLLALALSGTAALAHAAAENVELPKNSVYQLATPLVDQNGNSFLLAARRGQPMLVSMFYTSCQYTCPLLISSLKHTEAKLTADERQRLSILIVSFDPARDDVAKLKRTASEHGLDPAHWTLARTDAKLARKLAAVLGIQYRAMPDGEFNHTSVVVLVDAEGKIIGRTDQLGAADPAFVKLVRQAANSGS